MAEQFRKRPVVIEAKQLTNETFDQVLWWINSSEGSAHRNVRVSDSALVLVIDTLEGQMVADQGDWIIQGIQGEFYPCKPDIFEATYERVDG